jgi:hypothetical protein
MMSLEAVDKVAKQVSTVLNLMNRLGQLKQKTHGVSVV